MPAKPSRPAIAVLALAACIALAAGGTSEAAGGTVTACVKKRTGAVTVLLGRKARKKCPKGSSKVRWNTGSATSPAGAPGKAGSPGAPGATGLQGPAGPGLFVRDATGAVMGQFMGIIPEGVSVFTVLRDGGFFYYYGSGQVLSLNGATFTDSGCAATAYIKPSTSFPVTLILGFAGGPTRFTYRVSSPAFGPVRAWKLTTTVAPQSAVQLYNLDSLGACTPSGGLYTGDLIALESVAAPPDGVGPLTVS